MKQLSFPNINRVKIENFSLYKSKSIIEISLDRGVFCLAGANGLGKSTFLNILNYGLTGIVKRPDSEFSQYGSIPQFYNKSKSFAANYFDRRVDENSRSTASITIDFLVGNFLFTVKRGFFDQDELLDLTIFDGDKEITIDSDGTPSDLNRVYQEKLTEAIGLKDFDQFVFIQIFVLTFDETHQLLFWDESLMERVLYLFFNLDPSKAKKADQLRKDISTSQSNMRNLQWDSTQKEKELSSLLNQVETTSATQLTIDEKQMSDYQELAVKLNEELDFIRNLEAEIKECDLLLANYSLNNNNLKTEYDSLFNTAFNQDFSLEKDPQVLAILIELGKGICAKEDVSKTFEKLKNIIWETKCPNNQPISNAASIQKLKELDANIFKNNSESEKFQVRKKRLLSEFEIHRNNANSAKSQMDEIEQQNENFLFSLYKTTTSEISVLVSSMRSQIDLYKKRKDEETKKRDASRDELKKLEKELSQQYLQAEETFMPIFIDYAKSFLGLDINIYLQTYSKGASLILEVNDSERRQKHQLSESQRYFIDIALRLALIEYSSQKAMLLIDTPEGSLDIAYESRAGKMFADFSQKGYTILLTANINSSMLLKQLANQCRMHGMQLENMTNWTILSEVQQQEQGIINAAFLDIETILKGND